MQKSHPLLPSLLVTGLGVALAAFLVRYVGRGIGELRGAIAALELETVLVLAVVSLAALGSAWIIAAGGRGSARAQAGHRRRERRTELYQELLRLLATTPRLPAGRGNGDLGVAEARTLLEADLALLGHPSVVREYRALTKLLEVGSGQLDQVRAQLNRLLRAMRRDCGLLTYGLPSEDWSDLLWPVSADPVPLRPTPTPPSPSTRLGPEPLRDRLGV